MKSFHTQYFFDDQRNDLVKAQTIDNDFGSLVKIKGKRNQEQAFGSKLATSHGLGSTFLLKIVAL
jgi:hypothetical protein